MILKMKHRVLSYFLAAARNAPQTVGQLHVTRHTLLRQIVKCVLLALQERFEPTTFQDKCNFTTNEVFC